MCFIADPLDRDRVVRRIAGKNDDQSLGPNQSGSIRSLEDTGPRLQKDPGIETGVDRGPNVPGRDQGIVELC